MSLVGNRRRASQDEPMSLSGPPAIQVDSLTLTQIHGWAFRAAGAAPNKIRLIADDDRVFAQQTADRLREDVAAVWECSARCGFSIDFSIPLLPSQKVRLEVASGAAVETLQVEVHLKDCEPKDVATVVCHVIDQPQDYPYAGMKLDSLASLIADLDPEWRCALADEILQFNEWRIGPELVKFLRSALAPDDDPRLLEKLFAAELADQRLSDPLARDSGALRALLHHKHAPDLPEGKVIADTIMWAARNHDAALLDRALPLITRRDTNWKWVVLLRLTHLLAEAGGALPSRLTGSELNETSPIDLSRMLSATAPLLAKRVGPVAEVLAHEVAYTYNPESQVAAFNVAVTRRSRGLQSGPRSPMQEVSRIYAPDTGLLALPRAENEVVTALLGLETSVTQRSGVGASGPRISIVVPVRNGMPHIHRAIASILSQEYDNFQVIVIDGGSNDGTAEFLESLSNHFDYFVSEPDGGQSEAINKGLAQADGDYVGWLNADDELLPSALREVASVIQRTSADIVAGITVVERHGLIEMVTRTQMQPGLLSKEGLLDLFGKWFKGYYFYQPEVFIKRSTLEAAGAYVDEDLYYTMDYELWLRLADQGAQVAPCHWPVALFRQHPDQKTADLTSTTNEQISVWEKHRSISRPAVPLANLADWLGLLPAGDRPRVLFHSTRLGKIFSPRIRNDLPDFMKLHGVDLVFPDADGTIGSPEAIDLVVMPIHVRNEHLLIREWRRLGLEAPVVGWLWDNHHSYTAHAELLPALDVVVPGHSVAPGPLRDLGGIWTEPLPLCVSQWTAAEVQDLWAQASTQLGRSDSVWGGFVRYPALSSRDVLLEKVKQLPGFEDVSLITEESLLESYFALPARARFQQWTRYKTLLVWPLRNDLSQRFFDSLITGQVPIVISPPRDLEEMFNREPSMSGHVVCVYDPPVREVLISARESALRIFNDSSEAGIQERHNFGKAHVLEERLLKIVQSALGNWPMELL